MKTHNIILVILFLLFNTVANAQYLQPDSSDNPKPQKKKAYKPYTPQESQTDDKLGKKEVASFLSGAAITKSGYYLAATALQYQKKSKAQGISLNKLAWIQSRYRLKPGPKSANRL